MPLRAVFTAPSIDGSSTSTASAASAADRISAREEGERCKFAGTALAQNDEQLKKELFEAAKAGNAAKLKESLDKGANFTAKDEKTGKTALHYAVSSGNADSIKLMIDSSSNARLPLRNTFPASACSRVFSDSRNCFGP